MAVYSSLHVAGHQFAAGRHGQRHPGRAVAHEDAHFEDVARADEFRQEMQELTLLGSDLQEAWG